MPPVDCDCMHKLALIDQVAENFYFQPHMWVNNQDTKFTLGRFAKDRKMNQGEADKEDDSSKQPSALSAHHIVGYAYGGQRPHSESEHASNPNAVVIRGPHGIEVLSLLSGQPITHLKFPQTSDIRLDVDNDGELEHLVWDLGVVNSYLLFFFLFHYV